MQMKRIFLQEELNSTREPQFFSGYILKDACFYYKSEILVKVIFSIEKPSYKRTLNSAEILHRTVCIFNSL